jgi:hypothetical protein
VSSRNAVQYLPSPCMSPTLSSSARNGHDTRRRFACLPGRRLQAFDLQEERNAVKKLASRGEWGAVINSIMLVFLERLWGDSLDASIGSCALTPWSTVSCIFSGTWSFMLYVYDGAVVCPVALACNLSITPCCAQAIGSMWDEFSQEQRGFAVAV